MCVSVASKDVALLAKDLDDLGLGDDVRTATVQASGLRLLAHRKLDSLAHAVVAEAMRRLAVERVHLLDRQLVEAERALLANDADRCTKQLAVLGEPLVDVDALHQGVEYGLERVGVGMMTQHAQDRIERVALGSEDRENGLRGGNLFRTRYELGTQRRGR